MSAGDRTCWFCDGRLRGHEGVTIASLGGVVVHTRCVSDLGVIAAAPYAASDVVEDTPDSTPAGP